MNDKEKMIDFISRYLKGDCERILLACGTTSADDVYVDVSAFGDELFIEASCPKEESDWITVREIYEHLRWRAMPSWEQKELLRARLLPASVTGKVRANSNAELFPALTVQEARLDAFGDLLADKIVSRFQNNTPTSKNDDVNQAPYRFQRVGSVWHIHFLSGGEIKKANLKNNFGLEQVATLLRNKDRLVSSLTLARKDDLETQGLVAADRKHFPRSGSDYESIKLYNSAFQDKQSQVDTARMSGDVPALLKAEDELEDFKTKFGETENDFRKLSKIKEDSKSLEKSIHEAVNKNRLRLMKTLRNSVNEMPECADYLEMTIRAEGYGFAYRPSSIAPDWIL